jgi:hypothetical protein
MTPNAIFEIQAGIGRTLSNSIRLEIIHLLSIKPMRLGDIANLLEGLKV